VSDQFQRYGIFYTPTGDFAQAGANWLGWDIATARAVGAPDEAIIKRPQKYGFHGTIKPPFFLAKGQSIADLETAFSTLCNDLSPVNLDGGLAPARIGSFVALIPSKGMQDLAALAGRTVSELDVFRAPPSDAELERRRQSRLSPAQDAHLMKWGYPYVFDQFKFHMTLSGALEPDQMDAVLGQAKSAFVPVMPTPFVVDALSLVGERIDGKFELITRHPLS
jgi:hypothetical protein